MSLINLNSSNSKNMLINSGTFKSGVYITSPNQYLTYTDSNGMKAAYYYTGTLPYTTTSAVPDSNWSKMFITEQYSYLKNDIVPITSGGTGANTATDARTNLGLGTSATYNIGTDGSFVPLLSGVNTWSGNQIFNGVQVFIGRDDTSSSGIGLEIGSYNVTKNSYIDFHSSGSGSDYDARVLAAGGSSTSGAGTLSFLCYSVTIPRLALTNSLSISNGGTGATTADSARTNLGLGTSATYNVGTSGETVPLLSTSNTWSTNQTITGTLTIGTTGNTSVLTVGSSTIRDNGTNALIISSNSSGSSNAQAGIYIRPNSDTTGTVQIYGSNSSWSVSGPISFSSTVSVSGVMTNSSDILFSSTGKSIATASIPASQVNVNTVSSGTSSSLTLNGTSSSILFQIGGVTAYTMASSSITPSSTGKTFGSSAIPWSNIYTTSVTSGTTITLNPTANTVFQIASSQVAIMGSGNMVFKNNYGIQMYNTSSSGLDMVKLDSNNTSLFGNTTLATNIRSSVNPTTTVGSSTYTLYHTGNNPQQDIFRATYMASTADIKQTISSANTPQVLLPNTINQTSSYFTVDTSTGIVTSSAAKNISLSVSAEVIRETSSTTMVYWMMFVESSIDGSSWTTVPGSEKIVTLSPSLTNEIVNANMTISMATTSGMQFRIKQASTSSTSGVSVISKYALFSGAPISSGFTISIITI